MWLCFPVPEINILKYFNLLSSTYTKEYNGVPITEFRVRCREHWECHLFFWEYTFSNSVSHYAWNFRKLNREFMDAYIIFKLVRKSARFLNTWTLEKIQWKCLHIICTWEPGTSVSIVSGYGLDDRAIEVRSPAGANDFSSILCVQTGSGAHPASCTMGTGGPFPGAKARPGRDADHSLPSSAEVENE
jgi:hypothetical protein